MYLVWKLRTDRLTLINVDLLNPMELMANVKFIKASSATNGAVGLSWNSVSMTSPPDRRDDDRGPGISLLTRPKPATKKPPLYRVLLLNDDFTPMEFVIHVLQQFFNKNSDDAYMIMMHVHQNGVGECGVFTYEVAETKVTLVMDFARQHQHPLQCVMERN